MWHCKQCGAEIVVNISCLRTEKGKVDKFGTIWITEENEFCNSRNYSCKECGNFDENLDEIAIWNEDNKKEGE